MGLFDLFRSYFPANNIEQLGPNDLPSDVINDLRNRTANRQSRPHEPDHKEILPTPPHHRCPHDVDKQLFHEGSFQNIDREFQNVFREMDSMFSSFFRSGPSMEFHQSGPPFTESENGREKSLREKMLDDSENHSTVIQPFEDDGSNSDGFMFKFHMPMFRDFWHSPFERQPDDNFSSRDGDQDLDADLESGNQSIDDILDPPNQPSDRSIFGFGESLAPRDFSSAFKFSTVTKKINSDGSIETTSRKQDSDGNEEVVVSRSLGEQTHSITSKKNKTGEEEKIENFINMDQGDLQTFDERWKEKSQEGPRDLMLSPEQSNTILPMDNMSDFFASFWKPKL